MAVRTIELSRTDKNPNFSYSGDRREYLNGDENEQYNAWERFMDDYIEGRPLPTYVVVTKDVTEHEGRVVRQWIHHGVKIMSDVWADLYMVDVWSPEKSVEKGIPVSSVCLRNSECNHPSKRILAEVDATPEVMAQWKNWVEEREREHQEVLARLDRERLEAAGLREKNTVRLGKVVKIVKGRKVPLGTQGLVFWMGKDGWGKDKVGIATTDRREKGRYMDVVWAAASNCQVVI